MKNTKGFLPGMLLICLVAFFSLPAIAQQQQVAPQKTEKRAQKLMQALGITHDQALQLEQINQNRKAQMDQLKATNPDKKATKAQRKQINGDADTQIKQLLTPEQYQKYVSMKEEKKQNKKGKAPAVQN